MTVHFIVTFVSPWFILSHSDPFSAWPQDRKELVYQPTYRSHSLICLWLIDCVFCVFQPFKGRLISQQTISWIKEENNKTMSSCCCQLCWHGNKVANWILIQFTLTVNSLLNYDPSVGRCSGYSSNFSFRNLMAAMTWGWWCEMRLG